MASLAEYRRRAVKAGGVARMSEADRRAYGRAVLADVNAKNRATLMRAVSAPAVNCASGSLHTDGDRILAAVRAQNDRAIERLYAPIRTEQKLRAMYADAMETKREPK